LPVWSTNMKAKILNKQFLQGLVFLVFLLVFLGCSTQRNTWINRNFHALNAKYNGYFNARENYRSAMKRLGELHQDYYDQPLSIFRYGTEEQRRQITGFMEAAYQKSSFVIRRHSMLIKGVEHNPWIDDAYQLIALSHFFKGDVHLANFTFEFIYRQYQTPLSYDALVWIAKGHTRENRFEEALNVLQLAGNYLQQDLLSSDGRLLYHLTFADLMARQGNYHLAVPHITQAIENTQNRRDKTRLTFILGQYYQFSGNLPLAQRAFEQVLGMSPGFELALQARISMALTFDEKSGNEAFIHSELDKMIRDNRNESFLDRLYYAKGQLAWRENRHEQAVEYFRQSISIGHTNPLQKGLSFLRLGEIYFDQERFLEASVFYDSAVVFLPSGHANLEEIRKRQNTLSGLAQHIRVILHEDSLQTIAAMDQEAREALVDRIISGKREAASNLAAANFERANAFVHGVDRRLPGGQDGGWYFYNPAALNFGRAEFSSRFGSRPLEDMWRISNRQASAPGFHQQETTAIAPPTTDEGANAERLSYLQNIPSTPRQIEESNQRMANAYFNKGLIFKDQLNDKLNAITAFEALINRFPSYDNRLQVYSFLMNLWQEMDNRNKAGLYKGLIVSEFPESTLARAFLDPEFFEQYRQRQNETQQLYNNAYQAFLAGNFDQVLDYIRATDALTLERTLQSQFAYLKALSLGRKGKHHEFSLQLQFVVDSFPGTPVSLPAAHLLATLANQTGNVAASPQPPGQISPQLAPDLPPQFSYNPAVIHFFTLVVDIRRVDVLALRGAISTFNQEHFEDLPLTISTIFLDESRQLITVTSFPDKGTGMEYYREITAWPDLMNFNKEEVLPFIISVENYPLFYRDKQVDDYHRFFIFLYLN